MDGESYPLGKGYSVYPLEDIGKGRYGKVVFGEDNNHQPVAVKQLMYISKQKKDKTNPDRIVSECMKLLGSISGCNNIIKYLHYNLVNEQHWLVMEYCHEGDLEKYIKKFKGEMSPGLKVDIMSQCTNGMMAMHNKIPPIVHRQLTPQNILVRKEGKKDVIKISDFFLAKTFEGDGSHSTTYSITAYNSISREDMNTYHEFEYYRGPEYFQTDGNINTPSYDVFCMGLIFYGTILEMFPPTLPAEERIPIGKLMVDDHDSYKISLTSQDDCICNEFKNKDLEDCMNKMLQFPESDRPSASDVLHCMQELGYTEPEIMPEPDDNTSLNVSEDSHILQKFVDFLKINGPTESKDKKLREIFFQLPEEDMDVVLSNGSIKDYLLQYPDIKLVENKLVYVPNLQSDVPIDETGSDETSASGTNSEKLEIIHQKFTPLLYKEPLIAKHLQYSDINTVENAIVIVIDLQQNEDVKKKVQKLWTEFASKNNCNELLLKINTQKPVNLDWLMYIEVCVGPGSIMCEDKKLELLKSKSGMQCQPLYSIKDTLISHAISKQQGWGTLGCFAVCDHPSPNSVYAVSVRHLVNKDINQYGNESMAYVNMISGFEHTNEVKGSDPDFFKNTSIRTEVKDLVHISKEYKGFLGECIKQENEPVGKFVDIGIYGPLPESVFSIHCKFCPTEEKHGIKIGTVQRKMLVKKVGATTGFRRGVVIVDNYTIKSRAGNVLGNQAFLVTSYKRNESQNIELDQVGRFADRGDSGSIVLLDDRESNETIGLGLVHAIMTENLSFRNIEYENVIVCVRLNHCLNALKEKYDWVESMKLYYYHFEPKLFLAQQELPEVLIEAEQETTERNENVVDVYQAIPPSNIECLDVRKLASSDPAKPKIS